MWKIQERASFCRKPEPRVSARGCDEPCAAAPLEREMKIKNGYNVGPVRPGSLVVYMMPWKTVLKCHKQQLSSSLLCGARISRWTRSGLRISWDQTRRERSSVLRVDTASVQDAVMLPCVASNLITWANESEGDDGLTCRPVTVSSRL